MNLLPKHERYLDAFQTFLFLKPEHLRQLFGRLNERTLRWDLMKLMNAGYLSRTRNNKDEEYTYYPPHIREKSPLTLQHTNEITWAQVLFHTGAGQRGFPVLACERRPSRIEFAASVRNDEGALKPRQCVPDFFSGIKHVGRPEGRDEGYFFWEITISKPGQHWKKENDIIQKCEMYNAYFESGDFADRLQKELRLEVGNFRVVITFPTELRARNFVALFRKKGVAYPGRFWVTWQDAYRADMYGPIFLSPKDDVLHSFNHTV